MSAEAKSILEGVAIVGMAGRFPGARSVREFWNNQCKGIESISHFNIQDLEVRNKAAEALQTNYVASRSVLEDVDLLDAEFFGIYPREAELMDPQHRLFLEVCWEAIEDAGYDHSTYPGAIGVYAGCSMSTYFLAQICSRPGVIQTFTEGYQVNNYLELMGNAVDFLSTRVSYKLNLRGPSFTMQAGCSTSLLAVSQACQSLLTYQCDMALAGGASISFPQKRGVFYQEGGMVSPDGHCRTFDANAQGTVFGSGVAAVLLKRLDEAVKDGDQIYAVIRGFAVNNDGSDKVGYTAPSVEGQSRVIALAHEMAGIDPGTIGYIEAHGTATPLGDPIELKALANAFQGRGSRTQPCIIGSAKTNVGHLDIAAGVTGLINATHIVGHGVFPPTLHFKSPNKNFDLENSPFRVNAGLSEWKTDGVPRRAGISAFGVGGTNAHVVIEQAPQRTSKASQRPVHLLVLSARSEAAIERATDNLAAYLKENPNFDLGDVAWTLQVGRRVFPWKRTVVAGYIEEAISALSLRDRNRMQTSSRSSDDAPVYFMFPGQGSQYPDMARKIYETEPVFRTAVDRCAEILKPHLNTDIRTMLYPSEDVSEEAKKRITNTIFAQPAIFTVEYALAQLWIHWGVRPRAMLGHSIGEFVAACLAGVLSLEDALALVAARGRLMQDLQPGGMLSVRLSEADTRVRLSDSLSIAAVNSPSLCVVAGPFDALSSFEQQLEREGISFRRLVTSHAFHSAMIDPIVEPFLDVVRQVSLQAPRIPYVSGVSGTWITREEATDPLYWARHAREPVQFSSAITTLLKKETGAVFLEVGPGVTLTTLARQHASGSIISSLPESFPNRDDAESLMTALGSMWLAGVQPAWNMLYGDEHRRRVSLPTYPFERKRYWSDILKSGNEPDENEIATNVAASVKKFDPPSSGLEEKETVNTVVSVPVNTPADGSNRGTQILAALTEIINDLSGMEIARVDSSASFLEMGFDSLFLTQFTVAVKKKFGVKTTFRELLGDQSSLDALTLYIDSKITPEAFAAAIPDASPVPTASPSPISDSKADVTVREVEKNGQSQASPSAVERLMREQLQAMNELFAKQLDVMRGTVPNSAIPAPVVPSPAISKTTAVTPPKAAREEFKPHGPYRPAQKSTSGDLTGHQQNHLKKLVERWTERTRGSKQLTQEYRKVLADPRVVSGFRLQWKELVYPIVTERSKGSKIWDIDGNEYIDIVNGFGPIMLGHRPDFVEKAIAEQLTQGFETGPQSPLAGRVAKLFCDMTGNDRMSFCNTGSEAVLAAFRVARTVTGRSKIVSFSGDYHGLFDEVLVKATRSKTGVPGSAPVAPGIPRESVSNMIVLEYGEANSLEWIRQNADDLAAVIVEPVQSRHPDLQPIEFLKELREITQKSGTVFIFDEVVTGFRVHPGGCQALFGIRADLATYGKVVAGGMPVGILAGKSEYMDALDGGTWHFGDDSYPEVGVTFFAGTFVRHPLAVAAMLAVLEHFKERGPGLQEQLTRRTQDLVRKLKDVAAKLGVQVRIENFGSIFYVSFSAEDRFSSLFYYYMRDRGIHIREGFPCFLTTSHTDEDIAKIVLAFKESAIEMQEAGFLTARANLTSDSTPNTAPLTEAQREIFLSAMLGDDASCAFNESFNWQLRGPLNVEALRSAVNAVIARHDALRATVEADGNNLKFASALKLDVPLRDLRGVEASQRDLEEKRVLAEDARTPFDLINGPLVRAEILQIENDYHVLHFTSHHIVCDGWSTNVIVDEICKLYAAQLGGRHSADLPPVIPFSKYSQSQQEAQKSADYAECESYWLNLFKSIPPPLELPLDRPRPSNKSYAGATYRTHVSADSLSKIKKVGTKKGCTLFVTLLAGFQTLLHRLSQQDTIVVGIPAAGQLRVEGGDLVGHCVNFLPIQTRFSEQVSFAAVLGQVKKTLLDAYEHQSYTYGTLVRKLSIPRDPSRLPLMEVQFNLERLGSGTTVAGLESEIDPNPKGAVNFDLFLNVVESDRGLKIDCDYNTDLFDQATIAFWLKQLESLLLHAEANSDLSVDAIPLPVNTEYSGSIEKLSSDDPSPPASWNETKTEYPRDSSIVHLFEQRVALSPNAVALVSDERTLTYRELNTEANRLARHLRDLGVKPEEKVAICFERSVDLIVAILGILKAGCAYVPFDPKLPKKRFEYILADTGARYLVTQKKLIDLGLSVLHCSMIALDDASSAIQSAEHANLDCPPAAENLAYVMYTSGSTGEPKGVMIEHRSVVRLVKNTNYCKFAPDEVFLQFAPITFDASTFEIWGALLNGSQLVILPSQAPSLHDLGRIIRERKVTTLWLTAGLFHVMVEQHLEDLRPLRQLLAGGDVLSPWHVRQVLEKLPGVQLINGYGPTEGTTFTCCYNFARHEQVPDPVPIGNPISNTQVYILDHNMQQVSIGKTGELFVGGDGLARGYINSPELNALKFVAASIGKGKPQRLYRTGDLARFLPTGAVQFLGRNDNQIKLRGYRVELDEVEAVLRRNPSVRQACVIAERASGTVTRLIAYCVPARERSLSESDLREFLRSNLPDYMIPAVVVTLESLPLTPNGKVDRAKLPSPPSADLVEPGNYTPPSTPQEKMFANIVMEVLRVDRVGVTDNLFQLGADSLHIFQMASRAVKAGLQITPRMVLQLRTIKAVLAELNKSEPATAKKPSAILPVAREKYRVSANAK